MAATIWVIVGLLFAGVAAVQVAVSRQFFAETDQMDSANLGLLVVSIALALGVVAWGALRRRPIVPLVFLMGNALLLLPALSSGPGDGTFGLLPLLLPADALGLVCLGVLALTRVALAGR